MTSAEADVVVIGGGLVGICTALSLQAAGREVIVLERTGPGDGASGHNGGVFSLINCLPIGTRANLRALPHLTRGPIGAVPIDPRHVPRMATWGWHLLRSSGDRSVRRIATHLAQLLREAMPAYDALLGERERALIRPGGLLYAYRDAASFESGRWARDLQRSLDLKFHDVDRSWIRAFLPDTAPPYSHGTFVPDSGHVDSPLEFTRALCERFIAQGGRVQSVNAQSFLVERGRVVGVQTSLHGVRAGHVVLAAGAWSAPLASQLGARCLLDTERGYGYELDGFDSGLEGAVIDVDTHVAFTPRENGLRIVGASELAGLDTPPKETTFRRVADAARLTFPGLDLESGIRWMSYRPSPPDSMPYIGRFPNVDNVVAAFGHGHIGLTLAAVTGRVVTELVQGEAPSLDLTGFAPGRFTRRPRARR